MPRKVGGKGAALEVERNNTTKSKAKHNNGCATHIILFNSCNSTTEVLNSHFIYEETWFTERLRDLLKLTNKKL